MEENEETRVIEFKKEGVIFTFPKSLDKIFVERLECPRLPVRRPIIKVKLIQITDMETYKGEVEDMFELKVYFKDADLSNPKVNGDYKKLDLQYQLEGSTKWVSCKEKHDLSLEEYKTPINGWLGHGIAKIQQWEDPLIAWGP